MANNRAYLQLHTAIFLFGFTAIFGRLILMTELEIVWYRLLLTVLSMLALPPLYRGLQQIPSKDRWRLAGIGVLGSLHWVAFYGAIKYANVTVALSVLSSTAFFTSVIEPLVFKARFRWTEMLLGAMVIPGMYLIFNFGEVYLTGILLALAAALLAATFSVLNRKMIAKYHAIPITFLELGSGWVFLSLMAPLYMQYFPEADFVPAGMDWLYLLLLALLCTTFAYVLSINALRHVTAFTFNLSINLEPIYGIVMAIFLFQEHEEVSIGLYAGAAIIITAVFVHTLIERRARKQNAKAG